MNAFGIIFSHIQSEGIDAIARKRTVASIPFGGRYRLIDFALSNIVSADIVNVGVIAQKNYQSLMDHVGSGKDWLSSALSTEVSASWTTSWRSQQKQR